MVGLPGARLSLTPMEAGVPMEAVPSLARTLRRLTDLLHTTADGSLSLLWLLAFADDAWCKCRTQLVFLSHSRCMWTPMALLRMGAPMPTSWTLSRLTSISALVCL